MTDLKKKLGNATWRKYKDTTIDVDGEPLALVIRRAPEGVAVQVLDEARKAGDIDQDGKPIGETGAMRLLARMVATVTFEPGAVRPIFDRTSDEDLANISVAPWLMDIKDDATAALAATGTVVEKLKGNSEATPIER
ncbi:hypothetical protein JQX13_38870 [Archangium violaceum]|uniref:hypothetical protein n=1 Tax=Archangium violaceum TaxID=83451 RepID=UPI00193C0699|nr:hypothetical protein [Archangium violaceum]QRK06046.1 hypothetical protein JQX13_38870 [Archangium violaceum]